MFLGRSQQRQGIRSTARRDQRLLSDRKIMPTKLEVAR